MKKIIVILASLCIGISLIAADSPEVLYKKYNKALGAGQYNIVMEYLASPVKKQINKMPAKNRKMIWQMLSKAAHKKYTVLKVMILGSKAYIYLTFTNKMTMRSNNYSSTKIVKMYSKVILTREGRYWKIVREEMRDKPFIR